MRDKLIIEVVAGVLPNEPMPEYTKRFGLTGDDLDRMREAKDSSASDRAHGEALMYAVGLMDPSRVNWVRLDWIWL